MALKTAIFASLRSRSKGRITRHLNVTVQGLVGAYVSEMDIEGIVSTRFNISREKFGL